MKSYVIAVDLMGGDTPPADIFEASLLGVRGAHQVHLHFLTTAGFKPNVSAPHIVTICPDYISPEDHPLKSIRSKKGSTLCLGIELLQQKKIDALLTLGNTGALLAKTVTTLPCVGENDRPALLTEIPVREKMVAVLDVGASTQSRASHLVQFAFLGAQYMKKNHGIVNPKVALLNIGTEPEKGTGEIKLAFTTLSKLDDLPFDFVGNIEPNSFFFTDVDVVVTSGFAGNIFLKTAEGTAAFILDLVKKSDSGGSLYLKLRQALYSKPSFGGTILGIERLVVKCHGGATKEMIQQAMQSVLKRLLETPAAII